MKKITAPQIKALPKIPRLNLVNSCTGYKSCNLIATKSKDGILNVAIFSSVTHLGSDPAMLGFIVRPATVPRNTYQNIKDLQYFTVNHVTETMIADAHHTAANYEETISEFDKTNLEAHFHDGIAIPFVKNAPVQLLCKYLNEYEIKENNTIHVIAAIEAIFYQENLEGKEMWLQLDKEKIVTVNGLDGYCVPVLKNRYKYARVNQPTESFLTDN